MSKNNDIPESANIYHPFSRSQYVLGVDIGENDRSVATESIVDENGNIVAVNIINQPNEDLRDDLVDDSGDIISTSNHQSSVTFEDIWGDQNCRMGSPNNEIIKLTERIEKLESILKDFIEKDKKIYQQSKNKNENKNAIDDLEIE